MLIKAAIDSWYFMKVSNLLMTTFGINLVDIEKMSGGQVSASMNEFRAKRLTHQEAAVLTIAGLFHAAADKPRRDGERPNYKKMARHAMIIDGWAAEGKVNPEIHQLYVESVESALSSRER